MASSLAPSPAPPPVAIPAPANSPILPFLLSEKGVERQPGAGTPTDPEHSVLLGEHLPAALLVGIADKYVATFVADAQPFEGFRFDDPPVTVKLADGPWAEWNKKASPEPLVPGSKRYRDFAGRAAKLAPNMVVRMIEIASDLPRTEEGMHVGSTPEEIRRAYPQAKTFAVPGYYSDGDCGFEIPHVIFFQETPRGSCDKNGRIAHIWIR